MQNSQYTDKPEASTLLYITIGLVFSSLCFLFLLQFFSVSVLKMAAMALRAQRDKFIAKLHVEGLLDSFFDELEMLQDPLFIVQITTMYCEETTRIIEELTKNLEQPVVNYDRVDIFVRELKSSSASVGAQQVKLACLNFIQACKEKDRERCMQDLEMINHEFYIIRSKFKILHQIEKRIRTYNAMQR